MNNLLRTLFSKPFRFAMFLVLFSALARTASAQLWTPSPPPPAANPFTGTIHIVKFLDAAGAGNVGFVSDGPEIWRTADAGATWKLATTPVNFHSGWVNDITFCPDGLRGYAVVDSTANPLDAGVLVTLNGGLTWIFDDNSGTPDSGRGIYYNQATHLLFVSSEDRPPHVSLGLVVSADSGVTWSTIDPDTEYTGFAFTDGNRGVVATQGTNPSSLIPTYFWLFTTDGGMTWQRSHMYFASWQPVGIPTTETFFAATSNYSFPDTERILRSDNGGYSFAPLTGYTFGAIDSLNQSMAGDGCALFAASSAFNLGMEYSTNEGTGWSAMPMSPNPPLNTRFYVSPVKVWSFRGKQLFSAPRPTTGDIHVWPDTIAFTQAGCGQLSDTLVHIFGCNCGNSPTLIGDNVVRPTPPPVPDTIKVLTDPLPHKLCNSTSDALGQPTSARIEFQPTNSSPDAADIHLIFSDNGTTVDTIVHVTGNGVSPNIHPVVPGTIILSSPSCGEVDTAFTIVNTSCSCVKITSCNIGEPDADKCFLQLTGCNELPVTLAGGTFWTFPINFIAGLKRGTRSAHVSFNWMSCDGSTSGTTEFIAINASTTTNQSPSFRGFKIERPSCCFIPTDTTIYFVNTTCDTLTLNTPDFHDGHDAKYFTLDSSGVKPPLSFPLKLPPTFFVPMKIGIECHEGGPNTAFVTFSYTISTTVVLGGGLLDCTSADTGSITDTLSFKSDGPAVLIPTSKPEPINFGTISCCDSMEVRTVTITGGCKDDTLRAIAFDSSGGNFYMVSPGLHVPLYLKAGQTQTFQVGFRPRCNGGSGSTNIKGTVSMTWNAGALDVHLIASSTNTPAISLSGAAMNFDSINFCASKCDSVTITNASCNPVIISDVMLPTNSAFQVTQSPKGTTIPVGDSIKVQVCLNPERSGATGNLADAITFLIKDQGGTIGQPATDSLFAFVHPPIPGNTVTQLATDTICDTSTLDEQFTLTNTGTCYTYAITSATTGDAHVSVTTPPIPLFPLHIPVGSKQAFNVHIAPTGPGHLMGNVILHDSAGNNITVPYDITVKSCTGKDTLVFTISDSVILTPNCTVGQMTFTANSSSGGGTVTSVMLAGSPQFATPNASGTALPYTGTVTFDPNIAGNNTATLTVTVTINGVPSTKSVALKGVTSGAKSNASIGIVSPTSGCIFPNDTDLKEFDVMLRDTIRDSLGMTQLHFLIRYDGDLLLFNPQTLKLGPGWSLAGVPYEDNMGLHITLKYTPSGRGFAAAGDTIVKITQLGALSNTLTGTAIIDSTHFNDSAYEACTMKALSSAGESVAICIDTACRTDIMLHTLQGNLQPMSGIQVIPNPAHKDGSAATLHFTTALDADVTTEVLDILGNPVATLSSGSLPKGDHAIARRTNNMSEGTYFARIRMNGYTVMRKFVLQKD